MSLTSNTMERRKRTTNLRFWVVSVLSCLSILFCACESDHSTEFDTVNSDLTIILSKGDGAGDASAPDSIITDFPTSETDAALSDGVTDPESIVSGGEIDGEETAKYTPNY